MEGFLVFLLSLDVLKSEYCSDCLYGHKRPMNLEQKALVGVSSEI